MFQSLQELLLCVSLCSHFFIARFSFQSVHMNERIAHSLVPDNGSPLGSSMLLGRSTQAPILTMGFQNMEEPLGLPLSFT